MDIAPIRQPWEWTLMQQITTIHPTTNTLLCTVRIASRMENEYISHVQHTRVLPKNRMFSLLYVFLCFCCFAIFVVTRMSLFWLLVVCSIFPLSDKYKPNKRKNHLQMFT